jgi:hypothetical protein
MKTEIIFNHKKGIVTATFFDTVTIEEVIQAIERLISDPEYNIGMSGIYDLSHANLSDVDGEMIEELSTRLVRLSKGRIGKPKVAVVSEHSLNHGTVRLFKEYYWDGETNLEVFDSIEEAEQWLMQNQDN